MHKLAVLALAVAAASPAVARADVPPAPGTNPNTTPDTQPTPTAPTTDQPTSPDQTPATTPTVTTTTTVTTSTPVPPPAVTPPPVTPPPETATATATVAAPDMTATDLTSTRTTLWYEPRLQSGIGIGAVVGGGVMGFTDKTMRATTANDVNGLWDARFTIGTHVPVGLDVSYLGTASSLNTLGGSSNAMLVGTTVEAAIRVNLAPHYAVNPYLFGGAGWQRYDVSGRTVSLADSNMRQGDNSIEFPMGVGVGWRDPSGFMADVRGTFRANTDQGLVLESGTTGTFAPMHTWEASAALGYEF